MQIKVSNVRFKVEGPADKKYNKVGVAFTYKEIEHVYYVYVLKSNKDQIKEAKRLFNKYLKDGRVYKEIKRKPLTSVQKALICAAAVAGVAGISCGTFYIVESNYCYVNFETNGGTQIATQKVTKGSKATKPDNPTKDPTPEYTYSFEGWFADNATFEHEYNFDTPVDKNITLYAKWNALSPKVDYDAAIIVFVDNDETVSFSCESTDVFTVDWGDGVVNSETSHTYSSSFLYTIKIYGELHSFQYTGANKLSVQGVDISNVISLGSSAFSGCKEMWGVTIGNSITQISDSAFKGCERLKYIFIPNTITSIDKSAFQECRQLATVIFEENSKLKTIDDDAFRTCSALKSITIPNSVTSIGDNAFNTCSALKSITIPNNVTSIGEEAFYLCRQLATVTFEKNSKLKTIGGGAFSGRYTDEGDPITSIVIPKSVISIGNSAFEQCPYLETVTFEEGSNLKSIGNCTFKACDKLESITIPNSVTSIGDSAFDASYNLKTINLTLFTSTEAVPIAGVDCFANISRNRKFYVYSVDMKDAFIAKAGGWPTDPDAYEIGEPPSL